MAGTTRQNELRQWCAGCGATGYLMVDMETGTVIQSHDPRIKMMVSISSDWTVMTSEMLQHGHHRVFVDVWDVWMTFQQYVDMEMGWDVKMEEAVVHWDAMVSSKNTRKKIDEIPGNLEFVDLFLEQNAEPSTQQLESGGGEGALGVSAGAPARKQGTEHIDDPPEEQSEPEEEPSEPDDFLHNMEEAMRRSILDQKTTSELNPTIEVDDEDSQEVDGAEVDDDSQSTSIEVGDDSQTLPRGSGRRGSASSSAAAGSSPMTPAAGPEPALKRTKTTSASSTQ